MTRPCDGDEDAREAEPVVAPTTNTCTLNARHGETLSVLLLVKRYVSVEIRVNGCDVVPDSSSENEIQTHLILIIIIQNLCCTYA